MRVKCEEETFTEGDHLQNKNSETVETCFWKFTRSSVKLRVWKITAWRLLWTQLCFGIPAIQQELFISTPDVPYIWRMHLESLCESGGNRWSDHLKISGFQTRHASNNSTIIVCLTKSLISEGTFPAIRVKLLNVCMDNSSTRLKY